MTGMTGARHRNGERRREFFFVLFLRHIMPYDGSMKTPPHAYNALTITVSYARADSARGTELWGWNRFR
jgi:hypothetical protein